VMNRRLVSILGLIVGFAPVCAPQLYLDDLPHTNPAIRYFEGPTEDPVARLAKSLDAGKVQLDFRPGGMGYLPSLLKHLDIHADSQALVFSKSSFQAPKISPRNPRAIYFNDEVAVGFVPGGAGFEVAALDAKQGVIFYRFATDASGKPHFTRGEVCLKCHQGPSTLGVPGMFIGSVFPNADGMPARNGAIVTDHRTPFEDRWGGWYVNAAGGEQRDRANAVAGNPAEPDVLDTGLAIGGGRQNLTHLAGRFNAASYLTPVSDIVALMALEHQTQMANFLTRLGWEARIGALEGKTAAQLDADIEATVAYMLFLDEAPLREPIAGVSTFAKTFPRRGPRDPRGRSLRDFDLRTRLFRYPLSYMIYSAAFEGLPDEVRERIYRRLFDILSGRDGSAKYAGLKAEDRSAILEILAKTKPNLPNWWAEAARSISVGNQR